MTIEEAIEQLGKIELWDIDLGPRGERDRMALKMAVAALEKQEGQKPQRREGTTYVFCPACGRPNIDDYCPRCGQKIDWEETE